MHGNHIADPWDLPENPSTPGGVTTAPKPAKPGLFGRRPDDEPSSGDAPPADDTAPPDPSASDDAEVATTPIDLAADVPTVDPDIGVTDASEDTEDPVVAPARFDLGLEASESAWEPTEDAGAAVTDFGLVSPSNDGSADPSYEVDEPALSDEFVATNAPGRPDHSSPQLRDPLTILALDEDDVPGDEPAPGASIVSLDGEAPVDDAPDTLVGEEPRGFRLPGLSLFARSRGVHEAPAEATDPAPIEIPLDEPSVAEAGLVEPADTATHDTDEADPRVTTPDVAVSDSLEAAEADTDASTVVETEEPVEDAVDVTPVVPPPSDPFADEAAEAGLTTTEEPTVDGTVEGETPEPAAASSEEDPFGEHSTEGPTAEEPDDAVEIELIEPDLSEYVDVETLYVTEETPEEPGRTALVTVDGVPGASVSRALDVVTAVASASSADDIAGAIDRAMEQLREKATELGGGAVIAVRSEVQEIGVGFLVIASGTAVELT